MKEEFVVRSDVKENLLRWRYFIHVHDYMYMSSVVSLNKKQEVHNKEKESMNTLYKWLLNTIYIYEILKAKIDLEKGES